MRISGWSADVCSSDLGVGLRKAVAPPGVERFRFGNEMARHIDQLAGRPEVLHALGFQRRMTDAAPQALVIPHVVFQRRHVEVADHDRFARRQPVGPRPSRHLAEELRSEEHTSELQSQMRTSYAGFYLT